MTTAVTVDKTKTDIMSSLTRGVEVVLDKSDEAGLQRALKKFRKKLKKDGVMEELKERAYYKKPSLIKKMKRDRIKRINKINNGEISNYDKYDNREYD